MDPRDIKIEDYNYPLSSERIAQHPLAVRDSCKLLEYDGTSITDHVFNELPALLPPGSVLVCNNTRVINARLRFNKTTGALIEIFCLEPAHPADYAQSFAAHGQCSWHCLVGNAKKWKDGKLQTTVQTASGTTVLTAERADNIIAPDNSRTILFRWDNDAVSFSDIIAAIGEIPIPPYLNRSSEEADKDDYQTVYSHIDGSVAAPTAGLHFTPELMKHIADREIDIQEVTLHVGAGTFRPVKSDRIGEHDMHSELIAVPRSVIAELASVAGKKQITAVGTTSVRTLESLWHIGRLIIEGKWNGEVPQWTPYQQSSEPTAAEALLAVCRYLDSRGDDTLVAHTRIIIAPGYKYRIVDAMITNFHQPQSTLLLLVSAFIGEQWREVYRHALDSGYRFLSYGDACLFHRAN